MNIAADLGSRSGVFRYRGTFGAATVGVAQQSQLIVNTPSPLGAIVQNTVRILSMKGKFTLLLSPVHNSGVWSESEVALGIYRSTMFLPSPPPVAEVLNTQDPLDAGDLARSNWCFLDTGFVNVPTGAVLIGNGNENLITGAFTLGFPVQPALPAPNLFVSEIDIVRPLILVPRQILMFAVNLDSLAGHSFVDWSLFLRVEYEVL